MALSESALQNNARSRWPKDLREGTEHGWNPQVLVYQMNPDGTKGKLLRIETAVPVEPEYHPSLHGLVRRGDAHHQRRKKRSG